MGDARKVGGMSTQPEALRLADYIDSDEPQNQTRYTLRAAADELRRLSALEADSVRFRILCETSPVLCFMGQDYSSAEEFRAAIDAYKG